jgi:hypothetical protein
MRADEVQAAIARCLVDPDYLDPVGDRAAVALLPPTLLDELRLFRGFITRIKHTQLRRIVPLTLRLLAVHKLDIPFFTEAASGYQQARREGPLAPALLFAYFERELARRLPGLPAGPREQVGAMLRHEGRIWRTGRVPAHPEPALNPRLRPGVAVEHFTLDVLALATAVTASQFAAPATVSRDRFLLYRPTAGTTRIEEIDALSAWVLSRLDGRTGAEALAVALRQVVGAGARVAVDSLLVDATMRGLIDAAAPVRES